MFEQDLSPQDVGSVNYGWIFSVDWAAGVDYDLWFDFGEESADTFLVCDVTGMVIDSQLKIGFGVVTEY